MWLGSQPYAPAVFVPRKDLWYSLLLQPESIPRSFAPGKFKSMKNPNDPIGNRIRNLPACSALPQPAAPPRIPQMVKVYKTSGRVFQRGRQIWGQGRGWVIVKWIQPARNNNSLGLLVNTAMDNGRGAVIRAVSTGYAVTRRHLLQVLFATVKVFSVCTKGRMCLTSWSSRKTAAVAVALGHEDKDKDKDQSFHCCHNRAAVGRR